MEVDTAGHQQGLGSNSDLIEPEALLSLNLTMNTKQVRTDKRA